MKIEQFLDVLDKISDALLPGDSILYNPKHKTWMTQPSKTPISDAYAEVALSLLVGVIDSDFPVECIPKLRKYLETMAALHTALDPEGYLDKDKRDHWSIAHAIAPVLLGKIEWNSDVNWRIIQPHSLTNAEIPYIIGQAIVGLYGSTYMEEVYGVMTFLRTLLHSPA